MIFVPFLDKISSQYETIRHDSVEITLRGFESKSYPPPELFGVHLPVNLLVFNQCKTQRDVYLYVTGQKIPESWERYSGRVIHTLYQEIFKKILEIVRTNSIDSLDLDCTLTSEKGNIIRKTIAKHQAVRRKLEHIYPRTELETLENKLKSDMDKIFSYEKTLSVALIEFEISNLFDQQSGDPLLQKTLALSIGENFKAPMLGFTSPVSPDFRYKNDVVGDIKSGLWKDYYYHTITAYALAIEAHTKSAVNCGIVLHVDIKDNRVVPIHEHASFEVIDDIKRKRFLFLRDEKLRIAKEKLDPGLPTSSNDCEGCGFCRTCWGSQ
jgi:CRISPR/Cas system-associated exonuclease Cas4 (RecB family)